MDENSPDRPADESEKSEASSTWKPDLYERHKTRTGQSVALAVVGGLAGAAIGAALWGGLATATHWRVVWMAIVVGLIVGYAVRVLGKGVEPSIGALAVIFTALGCVGGNLLTFIDMAAQMTNKTVGMVVDEMAPVDVLPMLATGFAETFRLYHVVFYAIAAVAAYLLALRRRPESSSDEHT